jgi:RNA polymerase sigma-70 factor (ECF subfamily)
MGELAWLEETYPACVQAVCATLKWPGVDSRRALERAEEAVQEAISKALEKNLTFTNREHCQRWVVLKAKNLAIDQHRRELRRQESVPTLEADGRASEMQRSRLAPALEAMQDALAQLNEGDRQLIHLRFFDEVGYKGIARRLGLSVPGAHHRVVTALRRLRDILLPELAPS